MAYLTSGIPPDDRLLWKLTRVRRAGGRLADPGQRRGPGHLVAEQVAEGVRLIAVPVGLQGGRLAGIGADPGRAGRWRGVPGGPAGEALDVDGAGAGRGHPGHLGLAE